MKSNLNPNAKPFYPQGFNSDKAYSIHILKSYLKKIIPSKEVLYAKGYAVGQSSAPSRTDGREIDSSIPIGENIHIKKTSNRTISIKNEAEQTK